MIVENRPWGNFKRFTCNENSTVKIITILKNEELSLQTHKNRKELWYFLDDAIVQIGDIQQIVKDGDCKIINKGVKHRIFAKDNKMRLTEISFGKFNEEDEIRLEDKYGGK